MWEKIRACLMLRSCGCLFCRQVNDADGQARRGARPRSVCFAILDLHRETDRGPSDSVRWGKVRGQSVYWQGFHLRLQIDVILANLGRYLISCISDTMMPVI